MGKRLEGATPLVKGVARGEELVARAARRSTRNSAAPRPSSVVSSAGVFVVDVGVFGAGVCVIGVPGGVGITTAG